MPRFDATINGKSLASYGITPTTATVPQPDAKTYQADIPGRDGLLDYTDAYGVVRYDNRTVTVEAYEIGDIAARMEHRRAICSDMHGKSCKLSLSTLDGYTFTGRCSVEYDEDGSQTVYTLSFDCDPYMSSGERTFYANCAGGADLIFISGDKPVKPRIEVPRRSIIVFDGKQYEVDEGTWTFDGIVFKRGRNEIYVNTYTEPGTTTWGDLQSMTWEQIGKRRISELYWLGNEPKKRLTWGQLATHTWRDIGSKSVQEWYFSGTAEVVENAYINYEIGEL